jgi:hypothetical protein
MQQPLEPRPPLDERLRPQVVVADCDRVEHDERRRALCRKTGHQRGRWMQAPHQRREVETLADHEHKLAVDHEPRLVDRRERRHDLREVAGERAAIAAAKLHVPAVPPSDATEAVPLRLIQEVPSRQLTHKPTEHRRDRTGDSQGHITRMTRRDRRQTSQRSTPA